MNLDQIPLFALFKGKLGYLNDRERLIAQNVANADTPGYVPTDLKPFAITKSLAAPQGPGGVAAARTNAAHMAGRTSQPTSWKPTPQPDSEARLDGNQVVLEEQMMRMTEARLQHDAAIGLYQKSLSMLRLAARRPTG